MFGPQLPAASWGRCARLPRVAPGFAAGGAALIVAREQQRHDVGEELAGCSFGFGVHGAWPVVGGQNAAHHGRVGSPEAEMGTVPEREVHPDLDTAAFAPASGVRRSWLMLS
jgi:hypothetical protein